MPRWVIAFPGPSRTLILVRITGSSGLSYPRRSATVPADDRERRELLLRILGEPACRRLGIYRLPDDLNLSVVIPVYNEKNTIREIVRRVRAVPVPKQIILVDDCSHDGTRAILQA